MGRYLVFLSAILAICAGPRASRAGSIPKYIVRTSASPGPPGPGPAPQGTILQQWTFDNGADPDTQGWTAVDRTAQPSYFHIDNFAGSALSPLSGNQSLWCGVRACESAYNVCDYLSDGYGDNWVQNFESQPISVSGDVRFQCLIHYDVESPYDVVQLSYAAADNVWHELRSWTGTGDEPVNETIPAANHTGTLKFRFRVVTDNAYSDQDGVYDSSGAAVIDDILIDDGNATIFNTETFEDDLNLFSRTVDDIWHAYSGESYGITAQLSDGSSVLQQDPDYTNLTHFWNFYAGSVSPYICGGHPEQVVVPFNFLTDGIDYAVYNEIWSPPVSIDNVPAGSGLLMDFDVYTDTKFDNLVFYSWGVRSRVGGVWQPWFRSNVVYNDAAKAWKKETFNLTSQVSASATEIQVAIQIRDFCPLVCGTWGSGLCHSHGPLIDNVRVFYGNTPTGAGVVIHPVDTTTGLSPVDLTFDQVTVSGETSLTTSDTGPGLPAGFVIGDGRYYHVSTTATRSGPIEIAIHYDETLLRFPEAYLQLWHWDKSLSPDAWEEITYYIDTVNNVIDGGSNSLSPFVIGAVIPTAVPDNAAPRAFALHQNVPNPFNPITTITYDVPAGGARVTLHVYDATGRLVRTLVNEQRPAGTHGVTWDGRNDAGSPVSSGVYFYRMTAGTFEESRRMVLLK